MDSHGPRVVIGIGVCLMSIGLLMAPAIENPWQFYATLGVLVGGGANLMTYTAHSLFLPNWFVRCRGLAIGSAFSGAGFGAIVLLPWLQTIIGRDGWRASCLAMGLLVLLVIGPLSLLTWRRPEDIGLMPDGASRGRGEPCTDHRILLTLSGSPSNGRSRGLSAPAASGGSCSRISARSSPRYTVRVRQTKYFIEAGFTPLVAAWSLGIVSIVAIPGQFVSGHCPTAWDGNGCGPRHAAASRSAMPR